MPPTLPLGFRAQLGSLSESRHISTALCPNFKRTCNATVGLHRQSPDPRNEAIGTKFWHLVVKYQQNNIRALDYKQPHSHNTGQNRLQTPGAPTRFALEPISVSSPS
ncbi:hypothetical protein M9H77_01464 [Catharanthus roseus]|uniref:Uncharacterized protein n=1 Tax=Catharanthus roseus TaxID=4058 RepID=A0ACC0C5V7_CATRO|nr:hypothetical protein M9H77_01464 [Catharanthus roseus]